MEDVLSTRDELATAGGHVTPGCSPALAVSPATVLAALSLVREGRVFDLDIGRFTGMPVSPVHVPFTVTTYRTPWGLSNQGDQDWLAGDNNKAEFGFVSELVVASMHTGTHIDALCHIMRGSGIDATWFGEVRAGDAIGDFGPMHDDAAAIPPMLLPGVLLDVAKVVEQEPLPAAYGMGVEELDRAVELAGGVPRGAAILIRSGHLIDWPDREKLATHAGAGITLEAARWLVEELAPVAIGADTPALEQEPSAVPGNPSPVHHYLIRDHGIHILENVRLEELSSAGILRFLFVCCPLAISGATASLVRPLAVC
jgi:kynurenine formamidase